MATALARWKEAGLVEVGLPSGFRVRLRPLAPAQLVTAGLLPYELIGALVEAEEQGTRPSEDVIGRATLEYVAKEHQLAAKAVRDLWDDDAAAWVPVTIDPEDFASGAYDPEDVEAITEAAMARIRAAAEQEGVDAGELATFPDVGPGDVDREDGGAVRPAALDAGRDPVADARAAARRGARRAPVPG